jgi:hypothetical protein
MITAPGRSSMRAVIRLILLGVAMRSIRVRARGKANKKTAAPRGAFPRVPRYGDGQCLLLLLTITDAVVVLIDEAASARGRSAHGTATATESRSALGRLRGLLLSLGLSPHATTLTATESRSALRWLRGLLRGLGLSPHATLTATKSLAAVEGHWRSPHWALAASITTHWAAAEGLVLGRFPRAAALWAATAIQSGGGRPHALALIAHPIIVPVDEARAALGFAFRSACGSVRLAVIAYVALVLIGEARATFGFAFRSACGGVRLTVIAHAVLVLIGVSFAALTAACLAARSLRIGLDIPLRRKRAGALLCGRVLRHREAPDPQECGRHHHQFRDRHTIPLLVKVCPAFIVTMPH